MNKNKPVEVSGGLSAPPSAPRRGVLSEVELLGEAIGQSGSSSLSTACLQTGHILLFCVSHGSTHVL